MPAVVLLAGAVFFLSTSGRNAADPAGYKERACALDGDILERIERGHHATRSNDVTMVPDEPNFVGSFTLTSHSGPWDYLQNVPLVVYGPRYIRPTGRVEANVDLADVYPTVGDLLNLDLPPVDGALLPQALSSDRPASPPKLVVVVVWDGAGRRTLDRWPDAWPTLAELEEGGVSFVNATVGSSPSVTSATHSTLGTGTYPSTHGITANDLRLADGSLVEPFEEASGAKLKADTFADVVDRRFDNGSKVGLLAWVKWHIGMLGHGEDSAGGDADEMALIRYVGKAVLRGNDELFDVPRDIAGAADIDALIDEVDREDGILDGKWLENDIRLPEGKAHWTDYANPAWVRYQSKLTASMLKSGAYGQDEIPDIFLTNFKMTDLAGHRWGTRSEETGEILREQDDALARIVSYLERKVEDYVVVVTADHGTSPLPEESGAWPINQRELKYDVNRNFGIKGQKLFPKSGASGLHFDRDIARRAGVSAKDVAEFLNGYTIRENWTEESLPDGYQDRGEELVMAAAFPAAEVGDLIAACS